MAGIKQTELLDWFGKLKTCPKCDSSFSDSIETCPHDGEELVLVSGRSTLGPGHLFAGHYEILSILGRGGMSVVYRARHKLMDRIVAIKVLQGDADQSAIERFKQEAKSASLLNHPNIISIYDFGLFNEQAYLVMDCLEGKTIADILESDGRISPDRSVEIFRQICLGLDAAHRHGVVHRDLKPSNICLVHDENGHEHIKIVDFGIAKLLDRTGRHALQLTQTGEVFGSPLYMSPEQCSGKTLDNRSDIYSLGCLMYECLTGKPPLEGDNAYETMALHISGTPMDFAKACPSIKIPASLEAIVFRCLEKRPIDRYQSAAEIISDLPVVQPVSGSLKVKSVAHPVKHKKELFRLRLGFWTVFTLLAGLLTYMALDHGPENDRGTVLEKTIWNFETTLAQTLSDWHQYDAAKAVLAQVEDTARKRFSNKGRLITCLNMQYNLYKRARMFEDLEAVDDRIAMAQEAMLAENCDKLLKDLDEINDYDTNGGASVKKVLAPYVVYRLRLVVNGLNGQGKELRAESILLKAHQVLADLLGPKDPLVADLKVLLAESYQRQEKGFKARPYLSDALAIYKQNTSDDERKEILALLHLGQIDRDSNNLDAAKDELGQALKQAENMPVQDNHLLLKCLNSNANFLDRIGKKEEAAKLLSRASELEKQDDAAATKIEPAPETDSAKPQIEPQIEPQIKPQTTPQIKQTPEKIENKQPINMDG